MERSAGPTPAPGCGAKGPKGGDAYDTVGLRPHGPESGAVMSHDIPEGKKKARGDESWAQEVDVGHPRMDKPNVARRRRAVK